MAFDLEMAWQNEQQPVLRLVSIFLRQAIHDGADHMEFSIAEASSDKGFQIQYVAGGKIHECAPAPNSLFGPAVVVLCNQAGLDYFTTGPVKGRLETLHPASAWTLESKDLKKNVILSKLGK